MKAFTLVELLVSIAIFTTITTIAVVNNSQFNSSVLLTNLAYEIGLSIRQAQVYGITVKQSSTNTAKFDSGYGIHFDLTADNKSYKLFEDYKAPGGSVDRTYGSGDIDIEIFRIQKGNYISGIYLDSVSQTNVDITFIRPNPEASIKYSGSAILYGKAEICVKSPQGPARMVTVESTGQISVATENISICNNN